MSPERKRLYCIEDDEGVTELLKTVCSEPEMPDIQIVAISRREEAEILLTKDEQTGVFPDLILLDLNLKGESGLSILDKIRLSKTPLNAVQVITMSSDETLRESCLKHGANIFFEKPFREIVEVKDTISDCLKPGGKLKAA